MKFGDYDCEIVSDGHYRLDGGAMFGVVPRVLWQRKHEPDADNRIVLGLNSLLARTAERVILVDCGMGDIWSDAEADMYGLERPNGGLVEDLSRKGVEPGEVTDVVLTHLHFDHAGGVVDRSGSLVFPHAKHWVQAKHLRWAKDPTERDRRSFRSEILRAVESEACDLQLVDGAQTILPGVDVLPVHGHTPGQQLVLVGDPEEGRILHAGDLIPYASQIHLPWIMAFDLNPLLTLQEKRDILSRAVFEEWVLLFEHDENIPAATVDFEEGRYRVGREVEI